MRSQYTTLNGLHHTWEVKILIEVCVGRQKIQYLQNFKVSPDLRLIEI